NPSEGSIARRRSYAELISYLTPPIENAGLYKELSELKDLVMAYRQSTNPSAKPTYPFNPCCKFVRIDTMYKGLDPINHNDGNVVLIFSEQLLIRFDI